MSRNKFALTAVLSSLMLFPSIALLAEDHEHETGPHGGSLVELGKEEYHAEVVHDEKEDQVTIYLLGPDAKTAVGIDAKDIVVNAKVGGTGVQMKLRASPQKKDKGGVASRFVSQGKQLGQLLDDSEAICTLRVTIKGKVYSGKIEHHDDHEEKPKAKS